MSVYYNENDPKAAAWLRELIKFGQLPDGEVDERSIEDVLPADLTGFRQCHFFAGIGGWALALQLAGWPADRPVWTGSCPCQPLSAAGKGAGEDDERHLWPAWSWLIRQCRPPIIFGEQVASKLGRQWFGAVQTDLQGMGYAAAAADICAAGVGAPHWRQRLWFVGLADHGCECNEPGRRFGNVERPSGKEQGETPQWERGRDANSDGGATQQLANGESNGQHGGIGSGARGRPQPANVGSARVMANGASGNPGTEGLQRSGQHGQQPEDGGVGGVVNGEQPRLEGHSGDGHNGNQPGRLNTNAHGPARASGATCQPEPFASALNGPWANTDWLLCTDGKWRPVKSIVQRLADELPDDLGIAGMEGAPPPACFPLAQGVTQRTGLLRGFGNAIVPQVAQTFIEAVMGRNGLR